ncbi:MAG TPA: acetyl-CoA C-acetyltransferase [Oculatellaceae cyanobacterium]|jgi:acetyl-CoA C-acetyltransferase
MGTTVTEAFIISGARTPIGSFMGELSGMTAPELGAVAIQGALKRSGVDSAVLGPLVDEVIMGCVLPAGVGQSPARQALRKAGLPDSTGALTINKVCGSGMKAVMVGASEIIAEDYEIVIAGGMESMSQAPFYIKGLRGGVKMGNQTLIDGMIHDGLWDPYNDLHMGNCAEQCVSRYEFTRESQDVYAKLSYDRAKAAVESGAFKAEIEPVLVPQRKGEPKVVDTDEEPFRGDSSKLSTLRPAFDKAGGITAGNASTINDGAAALLLASGEAVKRHGLSPMARIVSSATFSQDPVWFTTAPIGAIQKALLKAKLTIADIDLFEINEAFAAVTMAAQQDLQIPLEKLNIHGGAVALGHPIGASGARILVTLLHALKAKGLKRGLAALCIGGGEATAMIVELV